MVLWKKPNLLAIGWTEGLQASQGDFWVIGTNICLEIAY